MGKFCIINPVKNRRQQISTWSSLDLKCNDFHVIKMKAISYRKIVIGRVFINFQVEYLPMLNKHTRLVINKYIFKHCHLNIKL